MGKYIFSWDFILALTIAAAASQSSSTHYYDLLIDMAKFISVNLIVVETILIAAFAVMASTSSDDFVKYMQGRGGLFDAMMGRLVILFYILSISVCTSFILSFFFSIDMYISILGYEWIIVLFLVFFFLYSMFYIIDIVREVAHFARARALFGLKVQNRNHRASSSGKEKRCRCNRRCT